jgi:5-methylcytosine-specific restriction endonuclease McrA
MGELETVFEKRWRTLEKRSFKHNLSMPNYNQVHALLFQSYNNGFKCNYCGVQLKVKDSYPYYFVFSLEHKKPLQNGGTNAIENLAIICHRCNIVKGPMSEETWRAIIKSLPPHLFNKMCNELFVGRMSDELKSQGLGRNDADE